MVSQSLVSSRRQPERRSVIVAFSLAVTLYLNLVNPAFVVAQQSIAWASDVDTAITTAAADNRMVMLHFTATWCGPCKELEQFVFPDPAVARAINAECIPVRIDVDVQKSLASQYEITSVPADVLLTPAGHVLSRQPSPGSAAGYLKLIDNARQREANLTGDIARQQAAIRDTLAAAQPQQNFEGSPGAKVVPAAGGGSFRVESPSSSLSHPATQLAESRAAEQKMQNPYFGTQQTAPEFANAANSATQRSVTPRANGGGVFSGHTDPRREFASESETGTQFGAIVRSSQPQHAADQGEVEPARPTTITNTFLTNNASTTLANSANTEPTLNAPQINPHYSAAQDSAATAAATPQQPETAPLPDLGIDGYCGVSLVEDLQWVKGSREFGCIHRGKLYLFASQEHLNRFQQNPDSFSPLLGGADPVVFQQSGKLVEGQRELGVFYGDPGDPPLIVLFATAQSRTQFERDPVPFLERVREAMAQLDPNSTLRQAKKE